MWRPRTGLISSPKLANATRSASQSTIPLPILMAIGFAVRLLQTILLAVHHAQGKGWQYAVVWVLPGICATLQHDLQVCSYGDSSARRTGSVFKGHLCCFFSYCQYLCILVKMLKLLGFKTLMGIDCEIR